MCTRELHSPLAHAVEDVAARLVNCFPHPRVPEEAPPESIQPVSTEQPAVNAEQPAVATEQPAVNTEQHARSPGQPAAQCRAAFRSAQSSAQLSAEQPAAQQEARLQFSTELRGSQQQDLLRQLKSLRYSTRGGGRRSTRERKSGTATFAGRKEDAGNSFVATFEQIEGWHKEPYQSSPCAQGNECKEQSSSAIAAYLFFAGTKPSKQVSYLR